VHFYIKIAENSSIFHKPPCILDSQLVAGKIGTKTRDSSPFGIFLRMTNPYRLLHRTGRLQHWAAILSGFDYRLEHRKSK